MAMDETKTPFSQEVARLWAEGWTWEQIDKLYVLRVFHQGNGESTGFGAREIQRLQFMRWLVSTGRLES